MFPDVVSRKYTWWLSSSDCFYLAILPPYSIYYNWSNKCLHSFDLCNMYSFMLSKTLMWKLVLPGKSWRSFIPSLHWHGNVSPDAFWLLCPQPVLPPLALRSMMRWTKSGVWGRQFLHWFHFTEINVFAKPIEEGREQGLDLFLSTCLKTYIRKWFYGTLRTKNANFYRSAKYYYITITVFFEK